MGIEQEQFFIENNDEKIVEPIDNQESEKPTADEFVINPENGKIVASDGQEYANIPRMQAFVRLGNIIRNSLPPVPEGCIRLWRGNRPDEIGKNPSFTNALEGIALPFLAGYEGKLSYVDVSEKDLKEYDVARGEEFHLPEELAQKAVVVDGFLEQAKECKNT
jgi:hypothetical protein